MATKKTVNKTAKAKAKAKPKAKPAANKKATARRAKPKASVKKPAHSKAKPSAKAKAKAKPKAKAKTTTRTPRTASNSTLLIPRSSATTRRPPNNPQMPEEIIALLTANLNDTKLRIEQYAAHLRSLDRKRLNGVGIKKRGFIDAALALAEENPEFLPHWLPIDDFRDDDQQFISLRAIFDLNRQISELLWNLVIEASDIVYTDALEYYAIVREAAKRRVDAAETIYNELFRFFKRGSRAGDQPTKKQTKRDFNALNNGKRDGKLVIENIKPKTIAGKRKVIDEKFADSVEYKETEEGQFEE